MSDTQLFASTEIVGALASGVMSNDEAKAFSADPKAVLASKANIDASAMDINVVANSDNEVNIALPYYSQITEFQVELVKDEKLADVAGGEIIFALAIFGGFWVGASIAGAMAGATSVTIAIGAGIGATVGAVATGAIALTAVGAGVGTFVKNKKEGNK